MRRCGFLARSGARGGSRASTGWGDRLGPAVAPAPACTRRVAVGRTCVSELTAMVVFGEVHQCDSDQLAGVGVDARGGSGRQASGSTGSEPGRASAASPESRGAEDARLLRQVHARTAYAPAVGEHLGRRPREHPAAPRRAHGRARWHRDRHGRSRRSSFMSTPFPRASVLLPRFLNP